MNESNMTGSPKSDIYENTGRIAKDMSRVRFFICGCIVYSSFYTFCLYRNPSGITYPFFVLATIICFRLFVKKRFDNTDGLLPRSCRFYEISCMLLGISMFLTDCPPIIFLNKLMLFVLMLLYFVHALYDTSKWHFVQHIISFFSIIFGSMGCLMNPLADYKWYRNASASLQRSATSIQNGKTPASSGRKSENLKYIFAALAVALPLLAVTVTLLRSADILFDKMFENIFSFINIFDFYLEESVCELISDILGIAFTTVMIFIVSYALWSFLGRRSIKVQPVKEASLAPVAAMIIAVPLGLVYILFSFVQIFGLFLGNLALPDGYTYAEYARQGFFQLLFVCILNIILVLVCLYYFKRSYALKAVLTVISVCTYIMTASSAMRMIMYIRAYNLTFLRIFVLWFLVVTAFVMSGVLIYIYDRNFRLFRYCLIGVTVMYLALSFSRPDLITAKYNLAHMTPARSGRDSGYILELSSDAAPVIMSDEFKNACIANGKYKAYEHYIDREEEKITPRTFNLSRFIAHRLREKMT